MTSRPWPWLLALTLAACSGLEPGGDESDAPAGSACTTELRPHFDGEGCCGEPVAEPLCSTGTIAFCEVRDAHFEPIRCYYTHNGTTKLRCASCRDLNDCAAAANRRCAP